jgi:hypothetical protein
MRKQRKSIRSRRKPRTVQSAYKIADALPNFIQVNISGAQATLHKISDTRKGMIWLSLPQKLSDSDFASEVYGETTNMLADERAKVILKLKPCILLKLDKIVPNLVIVKWIRSKPSCVPEIPERGRGSEFVRFTIQFCREVLKAKKLELLDAADFRCEDENGIVNLYMNRYTLLTQGISSWYGKFGFRPRDERELRIYNRNNEIISKLTMANLPISYRLNKEMQELRQFALNTKVTDAFQVLSTQLMGKDCSQLAFLINSFPFEELNILSTYGVWYELDL